MIDFIKLKTTIPDLEVWQQSVPHIDLLGRYVRATGELVTNNFGTIRFDGEYGGYKIVAIKPDPSVVRHDRCYLEVMGSMHKACKNENHSAFSWSALQAEIGRLSSMYLMDEYNANITNLEFGVNIEMPYDVQAFVHENLLLYKHKEFSSYSTDRRGRSIGRECSLSHYTVKAYDKGLQYDLCNNLFRFELKYRNTQELRRLGIVSLSDLRDRDKVIHLASRLLHAWNNVLVGESSSMYANEPSCIEAEHLRNGANPKYWMRLRRENRKAFEDKRRAYRDVISHHEASLHSTIARLLKAKVNELLDG